MQRTLPRLSVLSVMIRATLLAMGAVPLVQAQSCVVNSNTDDPADASAKVVTVDPSGWQGPNAAIITLRDCIVAGNLMTGATGVPTLPGMDIDLSGIGGQTIALADHLPMIFNNANISAGVGGAAVTIDGGGTRRLFFVSGLPTIPVAGLPSPDAAQAISVNLVTLILRGGLAKGGNANLGGGGMGAGGALFVNKAATATLFNVQFAGNAAQGGTFVALSDVNVGGGGGGMSSKPRGGGGMGGSGGNPANNGGGGGGIGTDGTTAGGGFGGTGIGQISTAQGFSTGFGGGAYGGGRGAIGGGGGGGSNTQNHGGFGGGGGSNQFYGGRGGFSGGGAGAYGSAGAGGFGGGGGRGGRQGFTGMGAGGVGGFGGGGGGCVSTCSGAAGAGGAGGGAGLKAAPPQGGGGAGFGGAVFVRGGGTLAIAAYAPESTVSGGLVTAGIGYRNGAAAGSGFFLMSGASTLFNIANSNRYTIDDAIADNSRTSLPTGASWTAGCTLGANDGTDPNNGGGPFACGASVVKVGTGTLVLNGASTHGGNTGVSAGVLAGNGSVAGTFSVGNGARVAPGDSASNGGVGTFSTGPFTFFAGAAVDFQLGVDQTGSDKINVTGAVQLADVGQVTFHFGEGNATPLAGNTYTLMAAGTFNPTVADFAFDFVAPLTDLTGTFAVVDNELRFTVDSVGSDRIFADGFN